MSDSTPRRVGTWAWTAIVAVVALVSSVASLLFEFRPDLKRDPRTQVGADVSIFAIDPHVTRRQFLNGLGLPDDKLAKQIKQTCDGKLRCGALKIDGERIYVRTSVQGFKSRAVALRLSLYEDKSQTRIEGQSSVEQDSRIPDSPSARSVVPVWIACPPDRDKRYFVRVELYNPGDESVLAVADSHSFAPGCTTKATGATLKLTPSAPGQTP